MIARVATRYVSSLLSLAEEKGVLDRVHEDLLLLKHVVDENRRFTVVLRSPIVKSDKKMDILRAIFAGKVHKLTLAFLDIICRKGRAAILPDVAIAFHDAYNEHLGIGTASVITATPLSVTLRKEMEVLARTVTRRSNTELEESVNADLIGGFVLKVKDQQIDASIRTKLKELELRFRENPYVKQH